MLTITNKTKRAVLTTEIETLRVLASLDRETIEHLKRELLDAERREANHEHRCAVLETDVHNMLGTIRVMADSSRVVRIRRASVQSADMATALPSRNTDTL